MVESTARRRARGIVVVVAGALATVLLVAASAGWWSMRSLLSSDWVAPRVDALLADPVVSEAIAARAVDEVAEALDVRSAAVDLLPASMERAVDLVLAGVRPGVERRVAAVIRSDEVRAVVATSAERAYDAAVGLVRGDGLVDGVRVVGDEVRLNLLPLAARAIAAFQQLGLFDGVEVPELDRGGDPTAQRQELAAALGRELPDDFGELVVYRDEAVEQAGDHLATAQSMSRLFARTVWVLVVGGIVLGAVSLVLSRRRALTAVLMGVGLVLQLAVVTWLTGRMLRSARELAVDPAGQIVIGDLVGSLRDDLLRTMFIVVAVLVAVLVATVWVSSRPHGPA